MPVDRLLAQFFVFSLLMLAPLAVYAESEAAVEITQGPPSLEVAEATFDFGTVSEGAVVQHNFELINSGGSDLEIRQVHAACGCTAALLSQEKLGPGEKTSLQASFNTEGFFGEKVKTIRVFSNDPKQSSKVLTLKGIVKREIEVEPPRLYFGKIRKGEPKKVPLVVSVDPSSGIQLEDGLVRSEHVRLQPQAGSSSTRREWLVVLNDSAPVGIFRENISIKSSSKRTPVINVPIFAQIRGDLEVVPADISFGLLEGPLKEPAVKKVVFLNKGTNPVSVTSVESDSDLLKASLAKTSDPNRVEVTVTLAEGALGTIRAKIKITTDHPDEEQKNLVLPVYGIVARKKT